MRTPKLTSALRYENPAAAIDFLCAAFGFARHFVAEEGGHVIHAQLRFGDNLLFLGPDHADDIYGMHAPRKLNGTNQCVCLAVKDVAAACAQAEKAGAVIVNPLHDTPYGAREFSCRDPEGHIWSISDYWGEPAPNEENA